MDTDGKKHDAKHHTVAGQTFYFSGPVVDGNLTGELRVSIGKEGMGAEASYGAFHKSSLCSVGIGRQS